MPQKRNGYTICHSEPASDGEESAVRAMAGFERWVRNMGVALTAIFEEVRETEGGGYVAYVEELPGAISEGDTLEEARENLRDAIALLLEVNHP